LAELAVIPNEKWSDQQWRMAKGDETPRTISAEIESLIEQIRGTNGSTGAVSLTATAQRQRGLGYTPATTKKIGGQDDTRFTF
jgi:hypothetical protein